MQHSWDDDQELLNDLGDALRESALAETIAEYGKGAYAWRIVDQDLLQASLSFDSSALGGTTRRPGAREARQGRPPARGKLAEQPPETEQSSVGQPVPELRSGPDEPRVLVFTAPESAMSLELEVTPGQVVGQIVPPGPGTIRVEATEGAAFEVEADDSGFFGLPEVPSGPVRLRCDTPAGRLVTDWVRL